MLLWLIYLLVFDCPMCKKIVPPNTLTVTSEWGFTRLHTETTENPWREPAMTCLTIPCTMDIIPAMEIVFYVTGLIEERLRSI